MIRLNLGCGQQLIKGYINVDSEFTPEKMKKDNRFWNKNMKYIQANILKLPFKDEYADVVEAHQTMEHLRIRDVIPAFTEIYRVLKPGGKLLISVPSFNGLCLEWLGMELRSGTNFNPQDWISRAEEFYGIQVTEGEHHRCPMTPNWITYSVSAAGFKNQIDFELFPKHGHIPMKGKKYGIIATSEKPYGGDTVFRHETIVAYTIK
jgi:predicted SAM-dependent methyltransferase